MITLYGYKKCDTCRKAEQALAKAGIVYTFVDITQNPPSSTTLAKVAQQANRTPRQMFNTSGVAYRENNIKDQLPTLADHDILALLASNGRLIKRPIVTDGTRSTVGFDSKTFTSVWMDY